MSIIEQQIRFIQEHARSREAPIEFQSVTNPHILWSDEKPTLYFSYLKDNTLIQERIDIPPKKLHLIPAEYIDSKNEQMIHKISKKVRAAFRSTYKRQNVSKYENKIKEVSQAIFNRLTQPEFQLSIPYSNEVIHVLGNVSKEKGINTLKPMLEHIIDPKNNFRRFLCALLGLAFLAFICITIISNSQLHHNIHHILQYKIEEFAGIAGAACSLTLGIYKLWTRIFNETKKEKLIKDLIKKSADLYDNIILETLRGYSKANYVHPLRLKIVKLQKELDGLSWNLKMSPNCKHLKKQIKVKECKIKIATFKLFLFKETDPDKIYLLKNQIKLFKLSKIKLEIKQLKQILSKEENQRKKETHRNMILEKNLAIIKLSYPPQSAIEPKAQDDFYIPPPKYSPSAPDQPVNERNINEQTNRKTSIRTGLLALASMAFIATTYLLTQMI